MTDCSDCYYYRNNGTFVIGNSFIERTWILKSTGLFTESIRNKITGCLYQTDTEQPCFFYEGLTYNKYKKNSFAEFALIHIEQSFLCGSIYSMPYCHVVFCFEDALHGVEYKYHVIVYEDCAAMKTYVEFQSFHAPMGEFFNGARLNGTDVLPFQGSKDCTSYEFFARTDFTDELVRKKADPSGMDRGSLLLSASSGDGFFILKESPCFTDLRAECDGNFLLAENGITVLGTGIRAEEIEEDTLYRTYACVAGVFCGDEDDGFLCLKKYQKTACRDGSGQETFLMANPWGDRRCLEHMSEDFVIRELEACEELGITHYQIDDGWQKGGSFKRMNSGEQLEEDYWTIDPVKFPHRFDRIADIAKQKKISLTLWFAPDFNRLYRNIREETELLLGFYRLYGISMFKIDGIKLRNKACEDRIESMLRTLRDESAGEIRFNLDITADPRPGYFLFAQYGNLFLENRYTAWGNYFPYLTLRNLWDLSRFVPPQRLQIEFLNKRLYSDQYKDNELAPANYSNGYIFAVALFANPLAWCEVCALDPETAKDFRRMIRVYSKYKNEIAAGDILPIGDRPDGYAFTGFQSHHGSRGMVIVYRERTESEGHLFQLKFVRGKKVSLTNLLDKEKPDCPDFVDSLGQLHASFPERNSFQLYRYEIQ